MLDSSTSRVFRIPPANLGLSTVESLTAYILRLAAEHHVLPRTLIVYEILPLLQKSYLYKSGRPVHDAIGKSWWNSISATLNSINPLTEEWVKVLEQLTLLQSLKHLTMLTYRTVLPFRGLMRPDRAWCEGCLELQYQTKQLITSPLLWQISAVTICVIHNFKLKTTCPDPQCAKPLLAIGPKSRIGYCDYCNRWLGSDGNRTNTAPTDEEFVDQQYIVNAVGAMLAAGPTLPVTPNRGAIAAATKRYISEVLDDNAAELARLLSIHRKSLSDIRDGNQLPQLALLLRMSKLFGTSPIDLLTKDVSQLQFPNPHATRIPATTPSRIRSPRKFNREAIRFKLQKIIESNDVSPLSMARVALLLDYDLTFLEKHLPLECGQITEHFAEYQALKKTLRKARISEKARQVTIDIHNSGSYPSRRRMYKVLGGLFRDKAVRQAYYDTMTELGYKRRRTGG